MAIDQRHVGKSTNPGEVAEKILQWEREGMDYVVLRQDEYIRLHDLAYHPKFDKELDDFERNRARRSEPYVKDKNRRQP